MEVILSIWVNISNLTTFPPSDVLPEFADVVTLSIMYLLSSLALGNQRLAGESHFISIIPNFMSTLPILLHFSLRDMLPEFAGIFATFSISWAHWLEGIRHSLWNLTLYQYFQSYCIPPQGVCCLSLLTLFVVTLTIMYWLCSAGLKELNIFT